MLSEWRSRVRSLFGSANVERELDEELRGHVERQTEAYEQTGLSHAEARRRAQAEFGGLEPVKEECRDARGGRWIEEAVQDLRVSARLLTKDRGFTAAVVVVLALGIGANATVFSLVNAVLIRDLPFQQADDVVSLGTRDTRRTAVHGPEGYRGVSYQEYQDWRRSASTFAGIAAYAEAAMNVSDDERAPERVSGAYVSANAFSVLGRQPLLGRDFRPDEDRPGTHPVVILGYQVWTQRYAGDARIIGHTIRVNAKPAVVVGVMPARFGFPSTANVWQPLAQMPGLLDEPRGARVLDAVARLAPGVTMARAQSDLDGIADRMSKAFPDTDADIRSTVWPYADRYIASQVTVIIAALMGAVAFVLLIACANVANLLLARGAQRSHEISVRLSLGATRGRIVRQLLSENVLLAAIGGAAGYGLALGGVKLLWNTLSAGNPPFWLRLTIDARSVAFLIGLCLGTVVLFGLTPALYLSRTRAFDAISQAPRTSTQAPGVRRWASALMIGEITLTLVLLGGAAFMMRSFFLAYRMQADFDTAPLLTMRVELPALKYGTPDERVAFADRLEERLGHVEGVAAGAIASAIPFQFAASRALTIDGRPPSGMGRPPRVSVVAVSSGFFETLNLHLLRGRDFTSIDGTRGHDTAIVNQRFAALYFPGGDPIGHRIRLTTPDAHDGTAPWVTVVAVSPTIRRDVSTPGGPVVYLPYRAQPAAGLALLVRTTRGTDGVVPQLRKEVRALDPDLPIFDIQTLDDWLAFLRWPERVFGTMFSIFACIGLIMAAVGLYAVTACAVRRRTHEIGIRMALGARAPHVWWLVLRRVIVQLAIGFTIGLPGAFMVGQLPWMGSADPWILASIALVVAMVACVAAFLPARRATRLDPLIALRYE